MTVRLASFSKSILGNYGKSFLSFKKVKKKITGHIINVQPNVNGFDYYGVFDLNGNFITGVKLKDEKFVANFNYEVDEKNLKVMSSDETRKVNSCQTASITFILDGKMYTHTEYYNCTVDNADYYLEMPGSGGSSFGNSSSYADYLNSMNEAVMIANTPTEYVEIDWNGEMYLFDGIDEKNPQLGKNVAKVNFKIETPKGSIITEWTDNQGRKHVHLNLKIPNIPSNLFDSFKSSYITQAGFATLLWDSIKKGKLVFPDPYFLVYGTWGNLIMIELDSYYQYKKNNP